MSCLFVFVHRLEAKFDRQYVLLSLLVALGVLCVNQIYPSLLEGIQQIHEIRKSD